MILQVKEILICIKLKKSRTDILTIRKKVNFCSCDIDI